MSLGISSTELRTDFLTLLVTQLQHQDPIDPVKQENFISQLAQFSTVEGIEKLNVQFGDVLYMQQVLSGFDLVDKVVSYYPEGSGDLARGQVSQVFVQGGEVHAVVDQQPVPIRNVVGVIGSSAVV